MNGLLDTDAPTRLTLAGETARDLMTANPIALREDATVREAVALFTDRGLSAAPVIDEAGLPVGVLSHSDLIAHERQRLDYLPAALRQENGVRHGGSRLLSTFPMLDRTRVRDIMTPAVFSIRPETPAAKVVQQLLALNVHRLFVVDKRGVLLGVISTFDVLRHLQP
jgi:CBS-domain-containing membrane protein